MNQSRPPILLVGMNPNTFKKLRHEAKIKRNRTVAAANKEYKKSTQEIDALESKLLGKTDRRRGSSLGKVIMGVAPKDHVFTVDDAVRAVKESDPSRRFKRESITSALNRLCHQGILKKVTNASGLRIARFARPHVDAPADKSLAEWAELVLRKSGKPMTDVEILVSMGEHGYELECSPKQAVQHVRWAMEKSNGFQLNNNKWQMMDAERDVL